MGWIENFAKYSLERGLALENTMKSARTKLAAGSYTSDDYVNDNLKLWVDAVDGWTALFPSAVVEPTPILFTTVAAGATTYQGFVAVAPVPAGRTPQATSLFRLRGSGTGTVAAAVQSDGTLKFDVTALSTLAAGDLYESTCYYVDTTGKAHLVAVLRILVI